MYLRTICTDLCLVWRMIDRSEAPAIAALVAATSRGHLHAVKARGAQQLEPSQEHVRP
jgi:hypothetical protein